MNNTNHSTIKKLYQYTVMYGNFFSCFKYWDDIGSYDYLRTYMELKCVLTLLKMHAIGPYELLQYVNYITCIKKLVIMSWVKKYFFTFFKIFSSFASSWDSFIYPLEIFYCIANQWNIVILPFQHILCKMFRKKLRKDWTCPETLFLGLDYLYAVSNLIKIVTFR